MNIYKCDVCKTVYEVIDPVDAQREIVCCGKPARLLKAGETDAATEKHVPVVSIEGNKVHVEVGSTIHPMTVEHHIAFIACVTDDVVQVKYLKKTGEPKADFELAEGEKVKAVYEYCNLHGLWVKEIA